MQENMILWREAMYRAWFAVLGAITIIGAQNALARADSVEKDDKELTLIALGTSLTANYQWPHELAEQLSRCLGRRINIEILAVAGANSSQAMKQFSSRRNQWPDIILIEFAINDADFLDGVELEKSKSNHKALLDRIRVDAPGAKVVLMTMNPVFGLRGRTRPQLIEYYGIYRYLAGSGIVFADLFPVWHQALAITGYKVQLPDGLHPTQTAASHIILPAVRNKIGDLFRNRETNACVTSP
jgi:acyl-CoA thioesterase-1